MGKSVHPGEYSLPSRNLKIRFFFTFSYNLKYRESVWNIKGVLPCKNFKNSTFLKYSYNFEIWESVSEILNPLETANWSLRSEKSLSSSEKDFFFIIKKKGSIQYFRIMMEENFQFRPWMAFSASQGHCKFSYAEIFAMKIFQESFNNRMIFCSNADVKTL